MRRLACRTVASRSKSGNGWQLFCDDCRDIFSILPAIDHTITDPPYEAEAHTKQRRVKRVANRNTNSEPLNFEPIDGVDRIAIGRMIAEVTRRWSIVFCQAEAVALWRDALAPAVYRRACVWIKPDGMPQLTGDRPGMGYESIVCAHRRGCSVWNGGGRTGVFIHNKYTPGFVTEHPTTKPESLMIELISLFTDPGETIFDPFAGSGTTGVAAVRLGRHFIGVERDPKYFEFACERLRAEERGQPLTSYRAGQGILFTGAETE